jgi:two-component system, NtrC family, sensor kinase
MSPQETAAFQSLFPRPPSRYFVMGRAFLDAKAVHFEDVLTELDYDARTLDVLQSVAKYRSFLGVPIFRQGSPIGVIGCGRREVKPFTATQIELLKTFADQAAIAIVNAGLVSELATRNRDLGEALEQQTATSEVLQVINSSPGDLAPVFDAMLEKALHLCDASFGMLDTHEGDTAHIVASRNLPAPYFEYLMREPLRFGPETLHGRALRTRSVVHIADISTAEPYRNRVPLAVAAVELGGIRTMAFIPLLKDDAVIGLFIAFRQEVRPFTDKQIALLQNFAAQAVIAMENARLITETREALEQQTATADVLGVINSSPGDLASAFDAMLDKAMRLCEAAFGFLTTYDGQQFKAAAQISVPTRLADYFAAGMDQPQPGDSHWRLLGGENLVHNLDQMDEEAYRSGNPLRRAVVELGGAYRARRRTAQGQGPPGRIHDLPKRSTRVYRQADRARREFRGASGDRDRECTAGHRNARGVGAADCDCRGVAGHQQLAGRPRPGVRRDARQGVAAVQRGIRVSVHL